MVKHALLVEDEDQQAAFTASILADAGFVVVVRTNAVDALADVGHVPRPVDLIVLDRRLPQAAGDEPQDPVGDTLLDALLLELPDSPFVIFTGYTGLPHFQFATRERGVIPIGIGGRSVDRVTAFEKSQTIEFSQHIAAISGRIDELDDVEADIGIESPTGATRRLLKRAASELGASSIRARPLHGGLAGAPVWLCQLRSSSGVDIGAVVIKQSRRRKVSAGGGLHTLLPSALVAAPLAVVGGMCDGQEGKVMQLAGNDPISLFALLDDTPDDAAAHLGRVADAIKMLLQNTGPSSTTIDELCLPLAADWSALSVRLADHGVQAPRRSLIVTCRRTAQHGDLHPGNILVTGGQPVLIDFDNEVVSSSLLDPVTALLSPLFHAGSSMRGELWPAPEQCDALGSDDFYTGSPCEAWMRVAWDWVMAARTSDRELWGLVLAYTGRQLKYRDVVEDPVIAGRAVALAHAAARRLSAT